MSEILSTLTTESEGKETKLAGAFSKLTAHATLSLEKIIKAMNGLKAEINALQVAQNHQRLLSIVVIGLLIWFLIIMP